MRQRVHGRGGQRVARGRGHQLRVADGQRGTRRAVALVARRHAVERREGGARERGRDRRHLAPARGRDGLGGVHHPAAAEGHDVASGHVVHQRGCRLGHRARAPRAAPPPPHPARRRESAPRARSVVSSTHSPPKPKSRQQLRRLRGHARAEPDHPLAVAEEERRLALTRREPARWSRPARGGRSSRPPRSARWRWSARAGRRGPRPPWCRATRPGRWPRRPRAPAPR